MGGNVQGVEVNQVDEMESGVRVRGGDQYRTAQTYGEREFLKL